MTLKFIYIKLSQASVLLPVYTGAVYYKKLNLQFRIFFYFFIIAALFEIQASIAKAIYNNNMPGQHVYTLVEFLAFSAVYYLHFRKNKVMRALIGLNMFAGTIIAFIGAFYFGNIREPNMLSITYSFASIITYTLVYFYFLFNETTTQYSWEHPMFWVSTGALIYFTCTVVYFMLKRDLLKQVVYLENIGNHVHLGINIVAHCFYAQSFRCFKKWKQNL